METYSLNSCTSTPPCTLGESLVSGARMADSTCPLATVLLNIFQILGFVLSIHHAFYQLSEHLKWRDHVWAHESSICFFCSFPDLCVATVQEDCSTCCGHWLVLLIRGKTVLFSSLHLQVTLSSPVSESHLNKFCWYYCFLCSLDKEVTLNQKWFQVG